jgi:hypothetical protein
MIKRAPFYNFTWFLCPSSNSARALIIDLLIYFYSPSAPGDQVKNSAGDLEGDLELWPEMMKKR